jgi:hypothetical protein
VLWQLSKANPILSKTTDCIQSTDHLHTKPDLLANLDASVSAQRLAKGSINKDLLLRLCPVRGSRSRKFANAQ